MKILIICESIDNSAAGCVFGSFLREMQNRKELEITLFTNQYIDHTTVSSQIHIAQFNKPQLKNSRFYKLIFTVLNFDLEGYSRVLAGKSSFNKVYSKHQPDIILVFAAGSHYYTLEQGYKLSQKYNIPLAIHLVDPMPAVEGWNEHPLLRNAIIKYVGKRLRHASFLSYTNKKMLDYQLEVHNISKTMTTEVLYNPSQITPSLKITEKKTKTFLYIGTLYNKRQPDKLIDAFLNYLKINQNAELLFVGTKNNYKNLIPELFIEKIKFIDWTNNPKQYLDSADVLIDIDADIENDVFISSKLINYMMFDKPILSISPEYSPARDLLRKCSKSIFISNNSVSSIFNQLVAINKFIPSEKVFREREKLRSDFQIKNITTKLINALSQLVKNQTNKPVFEQ